MKKFLVVALSLLSLNGYAADTKIACTASGYPGDSVHLAIENCARFSRHQRELCARQVRCARYSTHCEAAGVAGDNVFSTVENCARFTHNRRELCARMVRCK
jgi:hypothetical protein